MKLNNSTYKSFLYFRLCMKKKNCCSENFLHTFPHDSQARTGGGIDNLGL